MAGETQSKWRDKHKGEMAGVTQPDSPWGTPHGPSRLFESSESGGGRTEFGGPAPYSPVSLSDDESPDETLGGAQVISLLLRLCCCFESRGEISNYLALSVEGWFEG